MWYLEKLKSKTKTVYGSVGPCYRVYYMKTQKSN